MINILLWLLGGGVLVLVMGFLTQFALRYIYNYRITPSGIQIVLFRKIPVGYIAFDNIQEVRRVSFKEMMKRQFALRLGNRIWGQAILIQKKKGIFKVVLMTPDDADLFIQEILRHQSG